MSSAVIIALAVAAIVVLFAVVLLVTARKADVRGAGALSRETRRRDRDADIDLPAAPSGRSVERAAVEDRTQALVPAAAAAPSIWIPPDREEIGVNRRQFLNRATVTLMSTSLLTFAAAGFVAFLWPTAAPVFGGKVNVGKLTDILASIRSNGGFRGIAQGQGREGVQGAPGRHGGRHRRPVPEVPAPRLPGAGVQEQPVVRMPVPRLAVQPRG